MVNNGHRCPGPGRIGIGTDRYGDQAPVGLLDGGADRPHLQPAHRDRKVRTFTELERALEESRLGPPSLKVWVAQGLEEEAQAVWQEFSQAVTKGPIG